MGQILEFRGGKKEKPVQTDQQGSKFYCRRCDASDFKIDALGTIFCSECDARMSNISVTTHKGAA